MIFVTAFTFFSSDMGTWYWWYSVPFLFSAIGLFSAGIINKIVWLAGGWGEFVLADGSAEYEDAVMV